MVPGKNAKSACFTPCFLLPPSTKFGENLFSCEVAYGGQAPDCWMVAGGCWVVPFFAYSSWTTQPVAAHKHIRDFRLMLQGPGRPPAGGTMPCGVYRGW